MRATLIMLGLVAGSFLLGGMVASPDQDPPPLAQKENPKTVLPSSIPSLPPSPTSAPNPLSDYAEKLKKCLEDKENDPISQEIKKDRDIFKNPNSTSEEKNAALARISTNEFIIALKYDCFGTNFSGIRSGDVEDAWLIKDINSGDNIVVERSNGEQWLLKAKTWCSWCWRYEGRKVTLKFGYTSSTVINDDGDVSEFWTEDEIK